MFLAPFSLRPKVQQKHCLCLNVLAVSSTIMHCRDGARQQHAGHSAAPMQGGSAGSLERSSMNDSSPSSSCISSTTNEGDSDSNDDTAVNSSAVSEACRRVTLQQQSSSTASTHAYAYRLALPSSIAALHLLSLVKRMHTPLLRCSHKHNRLWL